MTSLLLDRQQVSEAMSLGKRLEKANWGYILIAGPICSGKTTLSRMLENFFWERYISVTTIREEDYLRPLEDIPHDANGYLIDCFDCNQMANKINYLIEHPEERKKMSDKTMNDKEKFELKNIIQKWQEIL